MAKDNNGKSGGAGSSGNRPVFSGSHDYFVNNVLPDDVRTCVRQIKSPSLYANNRDETFILVRSGRGKLVVNGLEYELKPNTLINLGPFHRYRYLPAKNSVLEVVETRTNSGTYVYMIANPYVKNKQFCVPSEPPVVYLTGLLADIANESMDGLLAEMENKSSDKVMLCFCYMMDLLGIITEKMPKDYFLMPKADGGPAKSKGKA